MSESLVYYFGGGHADGGRADRDLLGGKGANLAEMVRIGLPVPPGFTVTTAVCRHYLRENAYPNGLEDAVEDGLRRLERETGKRFGDPDNPLLLSVRSGAAFSMPGMMDTVLNLGMNAETAAGLARAANDERFAYDSYRRFVQMFGDVVLEVPGHEFEALLDERKNARGASADTDLSAEDWKALIQEFRTLIEDRTGEPFPDDPRAQLWAAIEAVFESWNTPRAVAYRQVHNLPHDLGTAVNVMTMVYGNLGDDSGTGVAFTRDPSTGEKRLYGEFLVNAQGEDVVAGRRTPLSVDQMADHLPDAYRELVRVQDLLERHYREMQDLEFTAERGRFYMLQTRRGQRTGAAEIRIAVEMVEEGLIDEDEAVLRVKPSQLDQLLHRSIDPAASPIVLAEGLPASPGAAAGRIAFDPERAKEMVETGEKVVLVRRETSPDDFSGMVVAEAIVTSRGGMTSHAAVVARGMGKSCVVGAADLEVQERRKQIRVDSRTLGEGDWITVDGTTGRVLLGEVPTVEPRLPEQFHRLMDWADARRVLRVRANADTGPDAKKAREFGAEGIGLCRTEHMFFAPERILAVRRMILAREDADRQAALDELLPMQRADFLEIFREMNGLPVTIRLLDPPLHEFLPHGEDEVRPLAATLGMDPSEVAAMVDRRREANPMLGHRGARLGVSHPEITEMQVRAIFEAEADAAAEGVEVVVEVMVPLVSDVAELRHQVAIVRRVAAEVMESRGRSLPYLVGTMIELPRAALTAGKIASEAEFFSFGTNDLTQTTYGISRDDAGTFLPQYLQENLFAADPFQVLDTEGVGRLIALATTEGREAKPDLKVGVCGEHGGEPHSVAFFHEIGLEYVSCSPFRVPVARLAAAHAALREEEQGGDWPRVPAGAAASRTVSA